jgi:hypothetical protein
MAGGLGKDWEDFLYDIGLEGRSWVHVNNAAIAYLECRIKGIKHSEWGQVTKSKLSKLLKEPQQVSPTKFHTPSEEDQHRIVDRVCSEISCNREAS